MMKNFCSSLYDGRGALGLLVKSADVHAMSSNSSDCLPELAR